MSQFKPSLNNLLGYNLSASDLTFSLAEPPHELKSSKLIQGIFQVTQNQFLLNCDDCRILISNGNNIKLDYQENQNTTMDWLQSLSLGVCLMQRGHLVFHANSFIYKDSSIILAGDSETGKSTLAAQFHKLGALFHADEIVCFDKNSANMLPGLAWPALSKAMERHDR